VRATVFIVDDDRNVNHSLGLLLESVGLAARSFTSAEAFLDAIQPDVCGCILLDIRMPGMSGLQLQEELSVRGILLPVVFITGYADVDVAVSVMKKGAFDFIEKPYNDQILLETIERAIQQSQRNLELWTLKNMINERLKDLTEREREILNLVVAGKSSNDISQQLDISAKTVAVHRANMMRKMHARSVADLVQMLLKAAIQFS
jgi:RNA polymerase sigma factor (sigma-70 family)